MFNYLLRIHVRIQSVNLVIYFLSLFNLLHIHLPPSSITPSYQPFYFYFHSCFVISFEPFHIKSILFIHSLSRQDQKQSLRIRSILVYTSHIIHINEDFLASQNQATQNKITCWKKKYSVNLTYPTR